MGFKVKICGLSTAETLRAAMEAGADLVGFVHFPKSPRHLSLEAMARLAPEVKGRARKVALTVDADDALLSHIVAALGPDMLQLHGHETPERVAAIRARFGLPVMKALPVAEASDLSAIASYGDAADVILLDAKPPRGALLPGGNGLPFDWTLVAGLDAPRPVMLSGGLDPDNVSTALSVIGQGGGRVDGVDVSSGVEIRPGEKSVEKIFAFLAAARQGAAAAGLGAKVVGAEVVEAKADAPLSPQGTGPGHSRGVAPFEGQIPKAEAS